jgi:hypothetical protein
MENLLQRNNYTMHPYLSSEMLNAGGHVSVGSLEKVENAPADPLPKMQISIKGKS